jgi:hypothetical protein
MASWMGSNPYRREKIPSYKPIRLNDTIYLLEETTNQVFERKENGSPGNLLGKLISEKGEYKIVPLDYGIPPYIPFSLKKEKNYEQLRIKKRKDTLSNSYKKLLPTLSHSTELPKPPPHIIKNNTRFFEERGDKLFELFPPVLNKEGRLKINRFGEMYSAKRREKNWANQFTNLEELHQYSQEAKSLYNQLVKQKNDLSKEELQRIKNIQERAVQEEQERIRQLHARIDPMVIKMLELRYEKIFESLNQKQKSKNQGIKELVYPSQYSGLMFLESGIPGNVFTERYKVLSKPYYEKAMKRIENLQKGGKTRKQKRANRTRKARV